MSKHEINPQSGGHDPAEHKECILCGRCLEVCPLFAAVQKEELSPKAKHFSATLLKQQPDLLREKEFADLAGLCLGCGRCEATCPQGLSAVELVAELRRAHPTFAAKLWKTWIEKGAVLWPAAVTAARLAPDAILGEKGRRIAEKWRKSAQKKPVEPWFSVDFPEKTQEPAAVALFPGCTAEYLHKERRKKAEAVLQAAGYELKPRLDWGCCGLTLHHAGLEDAVRKMHRQNIRAWRKAGRPHIASFCASCLKGLRETAAPGANGIDWQEGEREQWLENIMPVAELLGTGRFRVLPYAPEEIVYHTPCHARNPDPDRLLLQMIFPSSVLRVSDKQCCGLGGVMQLGAPQLTDCTGKECLQALAPSGTGAILSGCSGCVVQLRSMASNEVRVYHWLDVMDIR